MSAHAAHTSEMDRSTPASARTRARTRERGRSHPGQTQVSKLPVWPADPDSCVGWALIRQGCSSHPARCSPVQRGAARGDRRWSGGSGPRVRERAKRLPGERGAGAGTHPSGSPQWSRGAGKGGMGPSQVRSRKGLPGVRGCVAGRGKRDFFSCGGVASRGKVTLHVCVCVCVCVLGRVRSGGRGEGVSEGQARMCVCVRVRVRRQGQRVRSQACFYFIISSQRTKAIARPGSSD